MWIAPDEFQDIQCVERVKYQYIDDGPSATPYIIDTARVYVGDIEFIAQAPSRPALPGERGPS